MQCSIFTNHSVQVWQRSFHPAACGDRVLAVRKNGLTHLLVADGCGKGPEAAALARQLETVAAPDLGRPLSLAVLRRWNHALLQCVPPRRFVAVTVLELDERAGEVRVWNAGNPPALRVAADGSVASMRSTGPPLGILTNDMLPDPGVAVFRPQPGETLLAFTDGLTEQRIGGRSFGEGTVLDVLAGAGRRNPLEAVKRSVMAMIASGTPLADDLTVVQMSWAARSSQSRAMSTCSVVPSTAAQSPPPRDSVAA